MIVIMIPRDFWQFVKDVLSFRTYGSLFVKFFLRLPISRCKKTMDCYQDDFVWDLKPRKALRVIVVGAGISGLTTAIGELNVFHPLNRLDCRKHWTALVIRSSSSIEFPDSKRLELAYN